MKQEIHYKQQEPICMWHTIEEQTKESAPKEEKR